MRKIIIAIDGFSACGKSSTAKLVAEKLNYAYVDTGAMYRATSLFFVNNYINLTNPNAIAKALAEISIHFHYSERTGHSEVYLNGLNVESFIRSMEINNIVSEVSAIPEVRKHMVALQRKMGKKKGVVMDGRDIGTVVYPDADLKVFMSADMHVRAARRQKELLEKLQTVPFDEVLKNLEDRDYKDTHRDESPLRKAEDAYSLDTTYITLEEQVDYIINLATSKIIDTSDYILSDF